MVKRQHKVLSLILCLMLAVSAICVGAVGATAATGDTVYVRVNNGWSDVYAYMWGDGIGENQSWPGVKMTNVEGDVYSYSVPGEYNMIIFNNGSGAQTGDLSYAGNGKIYDLSSSSWSTYVENPTNPVSTTAPVTTPSGEGITVYLKNEAGWAAPNCYMWNSSSDENKTWPGVAMTSLGDDVWSYTSSKAYASCIFNGGGAQTDDLTAKDGYMFNNKTNQWTEYDTSPLQIKSYKADPASGIYNGSEVVLSAEAQSKTGATVYYKFSVTNSSGGTSVVSDFSSANTVSWTPSAAGTYTVKFEVKDSDGNENSRELSLTVESDANLVKPVIKSVVPGNNGYIKVNTNALLSVNAGGGKTGTNLLFYKYVVTDPNGVTNTPYYTLNNTYVLKPTMVGEYTVDVFVQGSDNSTVERTYKYNATTQDVTTPTVIEPTTIKPTTPVTQPTTQPTTAPVTTPVVLGDVNNDGRVTIMDATYIQKFVVEYEGYVVTAERGDVNGDGFVNIKDATEIQKIIAS